MHISADDVVQIRQRSEGQEPLFGWIVGDSPVRLMIETIVDAAFHGWRIVPTADITEIATTGSTRLASRMLRGQRRAVPREVAKALGSAWRELLTTIETCCGVVAITRTPDFDELFVGRVLRWSDDRLWILTISADGTIDPVTYPIAFADITCVEFGSPYTNMYGAAVNWEAALAAART